MSFLPSLPPRHRWRTPALRVAIAAITTTPASPVLLVTLLLLPLLLNACTPAPDPPAP